MSPFTIRPIASGDMHQVAEMIRELAIHHRDSPQINAMTLARDSLGDAPWVRILVAEGDNDLLGYAALCPLTQLQFGVRGMDMHHLFVRDAARGQGLGKALIHASLDAARAQGCRYVVVGTHPDNAAAQAIYRNAGFEDLPPPGPRFRIKW